ncbi:membrane protein [Streptomyces phage Zuko]|uniref:Membrane protein n=1 Tax=Streptomyces phage Zuko TaxID=2601695 RepID=A0A5J6D726_9CAUD|nr:membrane protein [Streptomyces phage Zuko]QEQ93640.1 membrane protein [Streptomyces phage Zuko]
MDKDEYRRLSEHYDRRIQQCILAGGLVFVVGMLAVVLMAMAGI